MLAILLAHTKLNGEPVDGGQSLQFNFGGTKGRKSNLLRKVSEFLMCEHWCVTHELVDNVGLWCVVRLRVMSNVLR